MTKQNKHEKFIEEQKDIIEALKNNNYNYVWERVKFIGYKVEKDIIQRRLIFSHAVKDFDVGKNDNFILFYKNYINYSIYNGNNVVSSFRMANKVNNDNISPEENSNKLVKDLKEWV